MKINQAGLVKFVKQQLSTNDAWATKAMVRIYTENQTSAEKAVQQTRENNGIGFNGTDGMILSSFSEQYKSRGSLSPKQMAIVKKSMPKYAKQVISLSDKVKLENSYMASLPENWK